MAWRFLNISKANAEIDRLALEVSTITKERDDLKAAMESNGAETISALEDSQAKVAALEEGAKVLSAERDAVKVELDAAKKELEATPVKISQKAQEITASQGQPPVATAPAATPAGGASGVAEQWQAITDPRAKTAFYKKNKAAIDAAWSPRPQSNTNK